jgi:hypothetical protein
MVTMFSAERISMPMSTADRGTAERGRPAILTMAGQRNGKPLCPPPCPPPPDSMSVTRSPSRNTWSVFGSHRIRIHAQSRSPAFASCRILSSRAPDAGQAQRSNSAVRFRDFDLLCRRVKPKPRDLLLVESGQCARHATRSRHAISADPQHLL